MSGTGALGWSIIRCEDPPYFVRALGLPRALTSWLPILILAAVGGTVLYGVRPGRSAPPCGHDALPA